MLSLAGLLPAEGQKNVVLNSLIEFTIVDDGSGINIASLIVEVLGARAVNGVLFQEGFDGTFSDITLDGDNYLVVVDRVEDFQPGQEVFVKVQVKNNDGKYFNTSYVFKAIPKEPVLTLNSPDNDAVLTGDQTLFLQFEDVLDGVDSNSIGIDLNGLDIVVGGVFQSGYDSGLSAITAVSDGFSIRIDPDEPLRNGNYILRYSVADTIGNFLRGELKFSIQLLKPILPSIFPQTGFLGFHQGIGKVSDEGTGGTLTLEWFTPISRSYKSEVFTLIYQHSSRLDIFDSYPKYIATSDVNEATIFGLIPGETLSFAARALEAFAGAIDLTGMPLVSPNVYAIPDPVVITQTILESDTKIFVSSVAGYPAKGYLLVGNEVIRYNAISISDNSFLVPTGGRGLNNTTPGIYLSGDPVKLFLKCQDQNTVIVMATPTYADGYNFDRTIPNEGRVVTDYSDNDGKFFQAYDFCGYHQARPDLTLQGIDDCPSYLGGEFNGMRGFILYEQMLNREEVLLDQTGEPMILLKRIWTGQTCSCIGSRHEHPKMKSCKDCFGTTIEGGYNQYINKRRIDTRLMVHINESPEDLDLGQNKGLEQKFEPSSWTLPIPAIRDRDLLVRFDFTGDIEFIYEVLDVSREKILYGQFGRQTMRLKRLDKTDIVYTFPFI